MRPALVVELESQWRANVRGRGSWELCRQAGRRRPAWSNASRAWVVSEKTARDVVAMAERAGMNVVVIGPRMAATRRQTEPASGDVPDAEENPEIGLW